MTKDQAQNVQDDIAFIKTLAEEGRSAPQNGGVMLLTAGLVFGAASVGQYLMQSGVFSLSPLAYIGLWVVAMTVFFVTLFVQVRAIQRRPGAKTLANRAVGEAWMGVGLAIFAMFVSVTVLCWRLESDLPAAIFPSLIMALYGSGWAVSAAMSKQRWQWFLAIGGWIAAPLLAFLAGSAAIWLAYAAGLFLFAVIPGWVLVRQEKKVG